MATDNPMGGERAVPLSILPAQARYLRRELRGFKADLEADVRKFADHPRAGKWWTDAEAYGRLAEGLERGLIVPDDQIRRLVREWAEAHERDEEYERLVFEHKAMLALRVQIGAGR